MTNLARNGEFLERRRMFVEAPFHNMKSYVPLDWSAQEATTEQLSRAKSKYSQETESLKKVYNQTVDKRLQRRYAGYVPLDLDQSRNDDILSREVEAFNSSKINTGEASRVKQETRDMGLQYQPLQTIDKQANNKSKANNPTQPIQTSQIGANYRASRDYQSLNEQINSNPESIQQQTNGSSRLRRYRQNSPYKLAQEGSPSVQDRYRGLDVQRSPYPRQDLSKLVEQLYTGSRVQQYPFRNVMPDKLQNHLREKTKADRKRAYQVTLNLFKH